MFFKERLNWYLNWNFGYLKPGFYYLETNELEIVFFFIELGMYYLGLISLHVEE